MIIDITKVEFSLNPLIMITKFIAKDGAAADMLRVWFYRNF
jgi:hypothetical protein